MTLIERVIEEAFNPTPPCTCRCHYGHGNCGYLGCCPRAGHPLDDDEDVWPLKAVYNSVWYPKRR